LTVTGILDADSSRQESPPPVHSTKDYAEAAPVIKKLSVLGKKRKDFW